MRSHPSMLMPMLMLVIAAAITSSCTFNFEVTSQRTALENQVMGTYRELEDDLVLISAVRAPKAGAAVSPHRQRALDAKQNQDFNRDDIDELKTIGVLGETAGGTVALLPPSIGKAADSAAARLAAQLVVEENRDREVIWKRI